MHSFVKLLAVYLAIGQSQIGYAIPVEERSRMDPNEILILSMTDGM